MRNRIEKRERGDCRENKDIYIYMCVCVCVTLLAFLLIYAGMKIKTLMAFL
jgi:hypothetical protein